MNLGNSFAIFPDCGLLTFIQTNPSICLLFLFLLIDITEELFAKLFTQIFLPKSNIVTKEGFDNRASNLVLVLVATASQQIQGYLQQIYANLLPREPNLLHGIFNENHIQNCGDRQVRWSYNRSLYAFYRTVKHYSD